MNLIVIQKIPEEHYPHTTDYGEEVCQLSEEEFSQILRWADEGVAQRDFEYYLSGEECDVYDKLSDLNKAFNEET